MRIDILSGVPELLHSPLNHSIVKRASEKGLATIQAIAESINIMGNRSGSAMKERNPGPVQEIVGVQ